MIDVRGQTMIKSRGVMVALGMALACGGCAATSASAPTGRPARLRFVSSRATQATWSFVVDDGARGAELLIDGRIREDGCDHVRNHIRCELRGLWPGGHTVEVRLPAAVLRRSVLLGKPWPARPVLVRVRFADEARAAAEAGADGVIAEGNDVQEIVDAAHAKEARAFVPADASAVEKAGADGVVDGVIPPDVQARFPEARALGPLAEAHDLPSAALAIVDPRGAIVEANAFPLLRVRKKHALLADGSPRSLVSEPTRRAFALAKGSDELELVVNFGADEWRYAPAVRNPLDLLGGHLSDGAVVVRPHDAAIVVRSRAPDLTRY
jgi:hypothetical protein